MCRVCLCFCRNVLIQHQPFLYILGGLVIVKIVLIKFSVHHWIYDIQLIL